MRLQRAGAGLHTVVVLSELHAVGVRVRGEKKRFSAEPKVFHSTGVCVGPGSALTAALRCPAKEDGRREIRLSRGCLKLGVLTTGLCSQGECTENSPDEALSPGGDQRSGEIPKGQCGIPTYI